MDGLDWAASYVAIFTDDGVGCLYFDTWPRLIAGLKQQFWHGAGEPDWWPDFLSEIEDEENWTRCDWGRFGFQTDIGEFTLRVYRVTNR